MSALSLTPQQRQQVRDILRKYLSAKAKAWVFGSRAKGTAKPFSDLDLAIDAGTTLSLAQLADLRQAFSESDLPWKVDVIDLSVTDASFRALIDEQKIAFDY